jgi:hypothetical protein
MDAVTVLLPTHKNTEELHKYHFIFSMENHKEIGKILIVSQKFMTIQDIYLQFVGTPSSCTWLHSKHKDCVMSEHNLK